MGADGLLIGEVAKQSGVSRKALRLYEALGIMPPPRRTPSGYRLYPRDALSVVGFVGQGRRLGLTLSEIKHIVGLRRAGTAPCPHVRQLLERKATELEDTLMAVRKILRTWPANGQRHGAICAHIEATGGERAWRRSPSVRSASRARKSSWKATPSVSARRPTSSP